MNPHKRRKQRHKRKHEHTQTVTLPIEGQREEMNQFFETMRGLGRVETLADGTEQISLSINEFEFTQEPVFETGESYDTVMVRKGDGFYINLFKTLEECEAFMEAWDWNSDEMPCPMVAKVIDRNTLEVMLCSGLERVEVAQPIA